MKISKNQLLTINDLKLSQIIEQMDDAQLAEYCKQLDRFIETFPSQETELKENFKAKNFGAFSKTILQIQDTLINIHATDLAQNCSKILNDVNTTKVEIVEAYLTYFLTTLSALSIDIQMRQHQDPPKGAQPLPQAATPPNAPASPASVVEERQKSILAVDDVSLLLSALKSALQSTTYKFTGVTSGAAALKFIKNHTPDLFLLDIEMPEMNGYELADRIKESGQKAPIVFLTGNSKKEYVLKAIQVGAVDFIVKPISKEQVLDKIKKYIG